MMPAPVLRLRHLFRTQRRRSACCSCPGDSASWVQAPCCHSDHKVWGCAAAQLFMKGWRPSPLGGCCLLAPMPLLLRHRHLRPLPCQTTSRFIPTPNILRHSSGCEHKDGSSLKSSCGTKMQAVEGFFIFIYHPKREEGGAFHPSRRRLQASEKKERKKSTYALLMF